MDGAHSILLRNKKVRWGLSTWYIRSISHGIYQTTFPLKIIMVTRQKSQSFLPDDTLKCTTSAHIIPRPLLADHVWGMNNYFSPWINGDPRSGIDVLVACIQNISLWWCHNEHHSVSNHRQFDGLFYNLFKLTSMKTQRISIFDPLGGGGGDIFHCGTS